MNLKGKSAMACCEIMSKALSPLVMSSERIKELIIANGGKCYKESNLERRMRESDKIRSVKVKGKSWVKYEYVGDL